MYDSTCNFFLRIGRSFYQSVHFHFPSNDPSARMRNAYFIAGEISAVVGNHAGHEAGAGGGGLNAAMDDVAFASVEKLANGMEWQFGASFVTVCSSLESWVRILAVTVARLLRYWLRLPSLL